jgi:glycosyltransferase involved in cell wall biosynthesis
VKRGPLVIVQVNTSASGGGAEAVARTLHHGLLELGHDARLLVGRGAASGAGVHGFPSDAGTRLAHMLAGPGRLVDRRLGLETYRYPATRRMLAALPHATDVVHLHNLHGGYFDLRVLPALGRKVPVAVTLHDAWLLSGHCAHSLGCQRWRTGCGRCPDLDIYPAVRRDATAWNWRRKHDLFQRSRLHVAAPSAWLADKVRASMLAPALVDLRVIPNGVDLTVFRPGDRAAARARLGLEREARVLLFVGGRTRDNPFKDRGAAEQAAAAAAESLGRDLTMIVLGSAEPDRRIGRVSVRGVGFQADPDVVATHYRASDLYLHAARADTFPSSVLEAMACGIPVVATAVGGIAEQVRSLTDPGAGASGAEASGEPTGALAAAGEPHALAGALARLLADESLRHALGRSAARDAVARFDATRQVRAYEAWFQEIRSTWREGS